MSTTRDMLDAAIRGKQATTPAQVVQEQEMVSTEPVQVTNGQTKAPGTVAVQTANSSTETPVVTTNTPTPTPVKTATPVANTTTDADGEGGAPVVTKTTPVTPTPTPAPTETKVPTWEEIVNELSKADEESEETKAKMKKKQRIATAIAALGDLATHAINVWGATNGYNAPIKGAPLTEGVVAKHKESLDAHAAKMKEYKDRIVENYKQRQEDSSRQLSDAYKQASLQWKWAETKRKEEMGVLQRELQRLNIETKQLELQYKAETNENKKNLLKSQIAKNYASIQNMADRLALAQQQLDLGWQRHEDLVYNRDRYYNAHNTQRFTVGENGDVLDIDKSLWDANWAKVYDVLAKDEDLSREAKRQKTSYQKKDFVRQHWYKIPEAVTLMEEMAGVATATATPRTEATPAPKKEELKKEEVKSGVKRNAQGKKVIV